jgi:hypothetical protein
MGHALERLDRLAEAQEMAEALGAALGVAPGRITLGRDRTSIVTHVDRFGAARLRARYRAGRVAALHEMTSARRLRCRFIDEVVADQRRRTAVTSGWLAHARAAREGRR